MPRQYPSILAFAASNSSTSINKQLVSHAGTILQEEIAPSAKVEIIDLNDYEMPIYSIDREEVDGIPQLAQHFFAKIGEADALMISYAEHNGFYTTAFKNIFDWCSRINVKVFQDKPMIIMSASVGPNGGANVLKTATDSAPFFGANILASFEVGSFEEKFDQQTRTFSDSELAATLRKSLIKLI